MHGELNESLRAGSINETPHTPCVPTPEEVPDLIAQGKGAVYSAFRIETARKQPVRSRE